MYEPLTGLDLNQFDVLTPEELNDHLMWCWRGRGPLYPLTADALMGDYEPEFLKLHYRACYSADMGDAKTLEDSFTDLTLFSVQNLPTYVMLGWETGIQNEFFTLRNFGMPKEQIMELVMFTQLYAGMRGLGHVYRAVGDFLPAWGPPPVPIVFPDGWAPDTEAFKAGLDLSTREMTATDRKNLESWYERNIGYLPKSIAFGLKHHPEFVKVNRAKWEVAIRTLPKQAAPCIMLRLNAISQNREGLREATLLCKAWGVRKKYIIQTLNAAVLYFTGFEGWHAAADAIQDVLDGME